MPSYIAKPIAELPKRPGNATPRAFNQAEADALLAIVSVTGETATDGVTHADKKAANAIKATARRLLVRVLPAGKEIKSRTYPVDGGGFAWSIWMADKPAETPAEATEPIADAGTEPAPVDATPADLPAETPKRK